MNVLNNSVKGNWELLRIREDKGHPNGFITARNVFISIFDENIS